LAKVPDKIEFSTTYSVLLSSKEIKLKFITRANVLGISVKEICFYCDLDYDIIDRRWIQRTDPRISPELTEGHIRKLLGFVGMETTVICVMKKKDKVRESIRIASQKRKLGYKLYNEQDKKPSRKK